MLTSLALVLAPAARFRGEGENPRGSGRFRRPPEEMEYRGPGFGREKQSFGHGNREIGSVG